MANSNTMHAVCTAFCNTNDDCAGAVKTSASGDPAMQQCAHDFVCAAATETGPLKCRKVCVCRDDLVQGHNLADDGVTVVCPQSCTTAPNTGCIGAPQ
jgi:hypothetical protein